MMKIKTDILFKKGWYFVAACVGITFILPYQAYAQSSNPHNDPSKNYQHCLGVNKHPVPKYGNQFPKGYKQIYNKCNHDIYIAWCFYDFRSNETPIENGDCGFGGSHFQKSWTLKPKKRHTGRMDIYQKFDVAVCKGTGKNSVNFKDGFNKSNLYDCKY